MNEPGTTLSTSRLWELYYRQLLETKAVQKGLYRLQKRHKALLDEVAGMPTIESIKIAERAQWFAWGLVFWAITERLYVAFK